MQKGNVLIFLLVGMFVIAAIGGAFYLGRSTTSKPNPTPILPSPTPQASTTPQPSSMNDETTNWKTYTGQYFTFKYPPDWIESTTFADQSVDIQPPKPADLNQIDWPGYFVSFSMVQNPFKKDFKSLVTEDYAQLPNFELTYTTQIINGITVFTTYDIPSLHGNEQNFFQRPDGSFIKIDFEPYNDIPSAQAMQDKYYKIFQQILSTFKFTQ